MKYSRTLGKWTLARCQNAKHIYGLFEVDAERIELLADDTTNKSRKPLVLMTKDFFEKITNDNSLEENKNVSYWHEQSKYWQEKCLDILDKFLNSDAK